MNRISEELSSIANGLIPCLAVIYIKRDDGVEKWAYNDIHFEIQRFLDRIRSNEGLETVVARHDTDERMEIEVGFSAHDERGAIIRELTNRASNICLKHGVKEMFVKVEDKELVGEIGAALELKKVARSLEMLQEV